MSLEYTIAISLLEAIVIFMLVYFFFKNTQNNNSKIISTLKLEIDELKKKISIQQKELESHSTPAKNTTFITSEIKKREYLEKEIERVLQNLEDTKLIAQEAIEMKSVFLSNIAHEIKEPLENILKYAKEIQNKNTDKETLKNINNIVNINTKLVALVKKMIRLSMVESGKFKLIEKAIDIESFFESNIEYFKKEAISKSLELNLSIDKTLPKSVMIDDMRVGEILHNLLSNAIKFTQNGHIDVIIRSENINKANNTIDISISVADTGIGLSSQEQKSIFEVFENRKKGSKSGIGLSLNKKLSNLMGGDLTLKSEPSKGSTFTLVLKDVEVVLFNDDKDDVDVDFSLIKAKPESILLVIDNVLQNRELIKNSLLKTPIKVVDFDNSRDAIEFLKRNSVDLILIDIDIFSVDEGAVSKVIKTVSSAPVITLTTLRVKEIMFKNYGVKPFGHLKKPLSRIELFKILLKVFNNKGIKTDE